MSAAASASAAQATQPMIRRMNYFVLKRLRRQEWKQDKIRQLDYKRHWNLYVGDRVEIITGQDRGKQGIIKQIQHNKNRLVVEGLRLRKRAERATMARTGYYYMQEGSIHVSNVNLVDPETGKRTRIKIGTLEDNSRVRVSVKTNNIIPKPSKPTVVPVHHPVTDTSAEDVLQVTYVKPDYSSLPKKPLLPLHTLTTPQLVGSALIAKIQAEEAAKLATSSQTTSTSTSESPSPSWYPPPHWNAATRRRMEFFRLKLTNGKPLNPVPLVTGSLVAHTIKKLRRAKEERMILESRVRYFRWQKKHNKIKRIRGLEHMTPEQQKQFTSQQSAPAATAAH